MGRSSTSRARFWIFVSGASFLVTLAAAALFVLFADRLTFIPNFVYYLLLVPLGAAAAAFLFGAMRSYARYSGKTGYGTLELGGPVVAFALVVLGGIFLANPENTFSLAVRVYGPGGRGSVITHGDVMVDLGDDRRVQAIGSNGQANFFQIPARFLAESIQVIPLVEGYAASDGGPYQVPTNRVIELHLERVPDSTVIRGTVFDGSGQTVSGARLSFGHGLAETLSDEDGQFSAALPAKEGQRLPLLVTLNGRLVYDNFMVVSESEGLRIRIDPVAN